MLKTYIQFYGVRDIAHRHSNMPFAAGSINMTKWASFIQQNYKIIMIYSRIGAVNSS